MVVFMRKSFCVSFTEEYLDLLDEFCKENGLKRSNALQFAFSQMLQQHTKIKVMQGFTDVIQRALTNGVLTFDNMPSSDAELMSSSDAELMPS